jgi:serine/threonine protein kinase
VQSGDGGWLHPRYILHEPLGQGGMGTVYRARDRLTGTWVALKRVRIRPGSPSAPAVITPASVPQEETLPPETGMSQLDAYVVDANAGEWATQAAPLVRLPPPHSMGTAGAPRMDTLLSHSPSQQPLALALAQEFRTLASLRHRHIVSVFDYGFDESEQPFFTMELVPAAEPFLRVCRQRDLAGRVTLLLDVLQALSYLHRRGVLHCDLKPSNVLCSEGRIIVLDFGLATLRSLTAAGSQELSGTLHYMAPELFSGRPASEASDLYAFGVMATQVLTGRRPFDADRSELLVSRVLSGELDLSGPELSRPLRQVLERLLAREPQARLSDATQAARELAAAAGMPLPPETAQLRESYLQAASFVGREPELAALRGALKRAMAGQGSLWLVGGESGVGKSRLLEELRTLALVRGVHVDSGQAITESHAAYQIFRDVLRSVALSLPLSPLEQSILLPIVPDLPALLGHDIAPPPELEPQAARNRLQTVLCDVLLRLDTPTVLILEDLHWAALESRELLARLLPALAERPLLILASYRDDECPQLAAELPGAKLLPLARLNARGMSELVESMLGSIGQRADLVLWLRQQTEGNPFFLVEILRALAEEAGSLANINLRSLQSASLPQGLGTVIKRRLSRLPGWALPGLKQAAIVGRRIDPELLRGFLAAGKVELEPWLAACAEAAVLEVHSEHWQFAHDKLREGVIAELSPPERASLHRQVADAIERRAAPTGEVAAVLAFHLQQADEPQRAYRYAILAGEAAIARGAPRESEEILAQAAALEPRGFPSLLLQVRLRRLRGKAQLALGHIDDCMRTTEEGLGLLGLALPASTRQLVLSLGRSLLTQGVHRIDDRAVFQTRLSRLLDPGLSPDLLREAQGLLASHAEVAFYVSSGQRFIYCALAAANLADQLRDEPQQIIGYAALAYNASMMSLPALSALYLGKADALRQQHRGTFAEFNFLRLRGGLYISQGRFQQSEIDLLQADQIAHDIGDTYSRLVALQQILWCRVFNDALLPSDDVLGLFVRLADSEGHRQFAARARVMEAHSLLLSGQPALAQPILEAALVQIRAARDLTFELHAVQLHARAALRLQQWETARADIDVLRSIFADSPILNYGVLPAASGLAEVSLELLRRASPLLLASYRHRVEQAFVVLERLAKYHAIARPILLWAQARRLRVQAGSSPGSSPGSSTRSQAIEQKAQAIEQKAQALAKSLR